MTPAESADAMRRPDIPAAPSGVMTTKENEMNNITTRQDNPNASAEQLIDVLEAQLARIATSLEPNPVKEAEERRRTADLIQALDRITDRLTSIERKTENPVVIVLDTRHEDESQDPDRLAAIGESIDNISIAARTCDRDDPEEMRKRLDGIAAMCDMLTGRAASDDPDTEPDGDGDDGHDE